MRYGRLREQKNKKYTTLKQINFIRHVVRIIFSVILSLFGLMFFNFGTFGNMIMFMGIYIGISLMIEPIFQNWEEREKNKKEDKSSQK
jgi:uncharacterized membrane protein